MERCRRQRGGASRTRVGYQTAIALDMGTLEAHDRRFPLSYYFFVLPIFAHIPTYAAVRTDLFSYVSRSLRLLFRLYLTPRAVPY